jgi:LPS export ABC transporter permease LptG
VRIVWRYLLARYLASLLLVLSALVALVLVVEVLLDVEHVLEGTGLSTILLKILSSYLLQYLLPAAALLGGFLALGGAARSREMTALKAGGISPLAATLPVLVAGACLSALCYLLSDTLVVTASQAFNRLVDPDGGSLVVRQGSFWYHKGRYVYNFADRDSPGSAVHDVVVFERDARNRLVRRISAPRAQVEDGQTWRFEDATVHLFDPDHPEAPPRYERAAEIRLELEEQPSAALLKREVAALSAAELRTHVALRTRQGRDADRARALLQDRYSEPFSVLLFALLAIPVGLRVEETRSLSRGALQAIGLMFAYYSVRELLSTLAHEGVLLPLAPWGALLLFSALGGVALARVPR